MIPVRCSSAGHAARSGEADWENVLGEADQEVDGMICPACARLEPPTIEAPTLDDLQASMAALQAQIEQLRGQS